MKRLTRRTILAAPAVLAFGGPLWVARPVRAAKQSGPGVTDNEIKIGNTAPYSGPPAGELMQLGYVSVDRDGKKDRLLSDPACRRRPPPPCDKRGLRHIPNQKRAAYPLIAVRGKE